MESIFETLETLPVSEECYNDIIDMIESILFEEDAQGTTEQKKSFFETDDDYKNPRKQAEYWAGQHKYYTEGEGRNHEYARKLAIYTKHLAKSYQKEADEADRANAPQTTV